MIAMHFVDPKERVRQLHALKAAIEAFMPTVVAIEELRGSQVAFRAYLDDVMRLLRRAATHRVPLKWLASR
jgi:hypothetical protein